MYIDREKPTWIDNWYEITDFRDGVIGIGETRHGEEVFSYLIKGRDKDLLIDTGMGIIPITRVLERWRSSSKPLEVVNTHWHFDHVGGNKYFTEVKVPIHPAEVAGLLRGWSNEQLAGCPFFDDFKKDEYGVSYMPASFDQKNFFIPGSKNINPVLKKDYPFDLGDRTIKVIETPGHTKGGICLFDETNGLLFTGDMLYEGPLYAFDLECIGVQEADPRAFLKSLKRLKRDFGDKIKGIRPGHNYPENECEPNLLEEAIELLEMANAKATPDDPKPEGFREAVAFEQPGPSQRPERYRLPRRLKVLVSKD